MLKYFLNYGMVNDWLAAVNLASPQAWGCGAIHWVDIGFKNLMWL